MRVKASSNPGSLAGAIAVRLKDGQTVSLEAIGAAAVNQAVKAVAIARGYMAQSGSDLVTVPCFSQTNVDGREKTSILLNIERR